MNNLAILLIDMQKNFLKKNQEENSKIIQKQLKFFKATKSKNFPTFVLEYKDHKETNPLLKKELENHDTTYFTKECDGGFEKIFFKGRLMPQIEKRMLHQRNSLDMQETELDYLLKRKDILNLLLIGVNKYGCVYQTGLEAQDRNYNVITCDELTNGKNHINLRGEKWFKENTKNYETLAELIQNL